MLPVKVPKKINTYFNLWIGLVFVIAAFVIIIFLNYKMREHALNEAKSMANLILNRNLSTHAYLNNRLKPEIFELTKDLGLSPDFYSPTWMSSTFAVREIDQSFRYFNDSNYYYKEAAVNARSPENEADAIEAKFLRELNTNQELKEKSFIRYFADSPYLVTMVRGETMKSGCLGCHGTPDKAPAQLVSRYGSTRGFNRQVGDVISTISIRIPVAAAYANANYLTLELSAILLMLFIAIFAIQVYIGKRLIFDPIAAIRDKVNKLSGNSTHFGETISVSSGKELIDLANSFNLMSISLRRNQENLEEQIAERTAHLAEINAQLEQDIVKREMAENELKWAQLALLEVNEKLRTIINSSPLGIIVIDIEGNISGWNPAAEKTFGVKAHEVIGQPALDPDSDNTELILLRDQILRGQTIRGVELRLTQKDGSPVNIRLDASPLSDINGNLSGIIGLVEDITGQKKTEQELLEYREKAEKALRMASFGAMAGGIAHEINQPLNSLKVITDSMIFWHKNGKALEMGKVIDNLRKISDQADRISAIIRHMRSISRSEPDSEAVPCNLNVAINEALHMVENQLLANDIKFEKALCNCLPFIMARQSGLEQIVANLILNAIEAFHGVTEDNRIINCITKVQEERVILEIIDNATGIIKEYEEKIFDPFVTSKNGEGIGLGLFLVQLIVEKFNGKISFFNNENGGATFRVEFPTVES